MEKCVHLLAPTNRRVLPAKPCPRGTKLVVCECELHEFCTVDRQAKDESIPHCPCEDWEVG